MRARPSWPRSRTSAARSAPSLRRSATAVVIGNHTQGLGVVRSAAAVSDSVWVVNDHALTLSRFSRRLSGFRRLPAGTLARLDEGEPATMLLRALMDLPIEPPAVLFGVDEDINRFIHRHRSVLGRRFHVPAVPLERIYDKHAFNLQMPEAARIDTRLCSESDLAEIIDPARFILKGRRGSGFRRAAGAKALELAGLSAADVAELFERIPADQVIVQEVIDSDRPVLSVCSFAVGGRLLGVFGYEKLRQHPGRFGTGTYLRSVDVEPFLPLAEAILGRLGYTGISEIELIHDPRTRTYKVVEMNPRTWKSIHFATRCGQNLVAAYLEFVATGRAERSLAYDRDRHWTDLATDLPEMVRQRRLWGYERGCFECTWDARDPLPALALWTLFPLLAAEERLAKRARLRHACASAPLGEAGASRSAA